jgi:phosphoglucosamine mutase
VEVQQQDISLDVPAIQQAIKQAEAELGAKGRVLLRKSGTEPLIRIMVEGEDEKHVHQLAKHLADVVKAALEMG